MDWKTENEKSATFKLWFVAFFDQNILPLDQRASTWQRKGQKHTIEFKTTQQKGKSHICGSGLDKTMLDRKKTFETRTFSPD